MDFKELVRKNRSYRRFDASQAISEAELIDLIDVGRLTPSGGNKQCLRFVLSCGPETNEAIFSSIGWAAYLPDWPGPSEDERPTGYVIILYDRSISEPDHRDTGITAQTILLRAVEKGYGGCMFGTIREKKLRTFLGLPDDMEIALVIALGKPVETIVLEDVEPGGSIKYYRDTDQTHHVPKRTTGELILKVFQ